MVIVDYFLDHWLHFGRCSVALNDRRSNSVPSSLLNRSKTILQLPRKSISGQSTLQWNTDCMRHSETGSKGRTNKLIRHRSVDRSPMDTSRWYRAIPNTFREHRSGKTRGWGLFPTARLRRWQILLSFHSGWWLGRRAFRVSNQLTRVIVGCVGRVFCWNFTGNTQSAVTFRGSSEQRI